MQGQTVIECQIVLFLAKIFTNFVTREYFITLDLWSTYFHEHYPTQMNKKTGPIKKAVTISEFHGVYNIADIGIYTLYTTYTYIRDVMPLSVNGGTESLEKFFNISY